MEDAKKALTMESSAEVIGLIKGIMAQSSSQQGLKPVDVVISEIINTDLPKSHRLSNAKRLLALSQESACYIDILGRWSDLLRVLPNDEEIAETLLSVFYNLSLIAELSEKMIVYVTDSSKVLLGFAEKTLRKQAMGIIGNTVSNYAGWGSFDLAAVKPLLTCVYEVCIKAPTIEPDVYACVVKTLSNPSIVFDFLSNENLIVKLVLSGKDNQGLLTVGLFSRIFEQLSKQEKSVDVADLFGSFLLKLLGMDNQLAGILSLSAVLQTNPEIGASILEKEGMLAGIVDTVEFELEDIQFAVVELISNAASFSKSRKIVDSTATQFLLKCSQQSANSQLRIAAYSALIKLMMDDAKIQKELVSNTSVLSLFTQILVNPETSKSMKSRVLEALSFISIHVKVKEAVITDKPLLMHLQKMISVQTDLASQYALAVIFLNLTCFPKQLTAEEIQLKKLQHMANGNAKTETEDTTKNVENRIKILVKMGLISTLNSLNIESENTKLVFAKIALAISTDQTNRGSMIQSGYIRKLLAISKSKNEDAVLVASQTLAKIAITSDPTLAFKGELSVEVLRPLVFLLTKGGPLAQFEALMGLTNLAGVDDRLREHIIRLDGLAAIQELQFSTNVLIHRAATEAIANLIYHPVVFSMFLSKNSQLLKVMVALCDDDDFNTRRAASGAIAVLSSEPDSIPLLFALSRFEEILLQLLGSDNPEILHRSIEIAKNVAKSKKLSSALQTAVGKLKNSKYSVIQQIASQI